MLEENLPNVCRACLAETWDFQSVFVSNPELEPAVNLSEMMMAFASVQVTVGDGLPDTVCKTCAADTLKLYLFKLKCEESDKTLREQLEKEPDVQTVPNEGAQFTDSKDSMNVYDIVIKPELTAEDTENVHNISDEFDFTVADRSDSEIDSAEVNANSEISDKLECPDCLKVFNKPSAYNRHIKTHTAIKAYKCGICSKSFTRNDLLLRHKIAHAMKMSDHAFDLVTGGEIVPQEGENVFIKTENALYSCTDCNLIFGKKDQLDNHIHMHLKNRKDVSCKICGKMFSKQAHLNRHMKIHSQIKPYVCTTCKKGFVRSEQLNNHMNIHSGIKPHVCAICLKGFNQISNLKDHMRTHNGEKPFLCSTCGKGFNQLGNLRQHTIRHSGIKAHLCSTCGNGFASKGELSAHLRKHTGARPFVCQVCNHGFTTSSSLTKHKRIHSGEKPYECDVCKMKFSRSGILARHKRTHTGEKPYVCKFCTKAFSQSNDLTSHLRIHTGEKPYICDACGQAFRQSSALKTHKKTHIDRNPADIKPVIGVGQAPFVM